MTASVAASPLRPWVVVGLLVTAIAVHAYDYSFLVPREPLRLAAHAAVVAGTAEVPQRTHLLVPWLLNPSIQLVARFMPFDLAFRRVYAAFHVTALALLLVSLYAYCRHWFTIEQSMVGALLVGATLRLPLRPGEYWDFSSIPDTSVFSPGSLLDPIFVAVALLLIRFDRPAWLAAVMIAASLNSEIALVLPLLYLLAGDLNGRRVGIAAGFFLLCAGVLMTLRLMADAGPFAGISITWRENLAHLPSTIINLTLFLGFGWLLCLFGLRRAPRFVQRQAMAVPIYLIVIAVWGFWWDVRNLMPLYPLLLPPALSAIFPPGPPADQ